MNIFRVIFLLVGIIFGYGFVVSGSWLAFIIACVTVATAVVPPRWLDK